MYFLNCHCRVEYDFGSNTENMKKVGVGALDLQCATPLPLLSFGPAGLPIHNDNFGKIPAALGRSDSHGETARLPECRPRGTFAGQQIKRLCKDKRCEDERDI